MENCQLILNSNSLCVICLSEVEVKANKSDLFPLHHLTSKINSNLGSVFKNVTCPWAPHAVLDRFEILADVCEGCVDLCEELLYKFQDDVGRENCIKLILDKMKKVGLKDKYKNCDSAFAVFYSGIVDRLRKEIMKKLRLKPELGEKSNESVTRIRAGLREIPNLLNIPDLPISQICSYLSWKDMKTCSTVSKGMRRLVFPSVIKSSIIKLKDQAKIPAMIDFIKSISNNFKKNVNLSIYSDRFDVFPDNSDDSSDDSESLGDYREPSKEDIRSTLLQLFRECGPNINSLKLTYDIVDSCHEIECGLRDENCIPVLGIGHELFPNLKRLEIRNFMELERLDGKPRQDVIDAILTFVKALLRNSPTLRELKLGHFNDGIAAPPFFKFIGELELRIDTLDINQTNIEDDDLKNLQSLKLKRLIILGFFFLEDSQSLTDFLESQSATLECLHLENPYNCFLRDHCLPHFTFPRMEVLAACKLLDTDKPYWDMEDDDDEDDVEELTPISYQTQLPNLKKLELTHVKEDHLLTFFPSDASPTTSVKELRILLPILEKTIFVRSTVIFESLSKLEVPVAKYLNDFWKDLTTLEELTLYPKSSHGTEESEEKITWIDEIITGLYISCPDLPWVRDLQSYEEEYEEMETKQSLALLTRLRLLRIRRRGINYGPRLRLSDICCMVVLIKMESLKYVDFCGARPASVGASMKVLDEMGKKINLCFGEERQERSWYD